MEVRIIQFSSRCARNVIRFRSRKFSASSLPPKQSSPLRWVPLVVGGACVAGGALEYIYPKSITGLFLDKQDPVIAKVDLEASNPEEETDLSEECSEDAAPIDPEAEDDCPFSWPEEWLEDETQTESEATKDETLEEPPPKANEDVAEVDQEADDACPFSCPEEWLIDESQDEPETTATETSELQSELVNEEAE